MFDFFVVIINIKTYFSNDFDYHIFFLNFQKKILKTNQEELSVKCKHGWNPKKTYTYATRAHNV